VRRVGPRRVGPPPVGPPRVGPPRDGPPRVGPPVALRRDSAPADGALGVGVVALAARLAPSAGRHPVGGVSPAHCSGQWAGAFSTRRIATGTVPELPSQAGRRTGERRRNRRAAPDGRDARAGAAIR